MFIFHYCLKKKKTSQIECLSCIPQSVHCIFFLPAPSKLLIDDRIDCLMVQSREIRTGSCWWTIYRDTLGVGEL